MATSESNTCARARLPILTMLYMTANTHVESALSTFTTPPHTATHRHTHKMYVSDTATHANGASGDGQLPPTAIKGLQLKVVGTMDAGGQERHELRWVLLVNERQQVVCLVGNHALVIGQQHDQVLGALARMQRALRQQGLDQRQAHAAHFGLLVKQERHALLQVALNDAACDAAHAHTRLGRRGVSNEAASNEPTVFHHVRSCWSVEIRGRENGAGTRAGSGSQCFGLL